MHDINDIYLLANSSFVKMFEVMSEKCYFLFLSSSLKQRVIEVKRSKKLRNSKSVLFETWIATNVLAFTGSDENR